MGRELRRSSPPSDLNEDDRSIWQHAYEFALANGLNDRYAQQMADKSVLKAPGRAWQFLAQFEQYERQIQRDEPETLSLKWQLFMWNYIDPEQEALIPETYGTGLMDPEIALKLFPLRWDLIRRGRRDPQDQVDYANRIAAIVEVVQAAGAARSDFIEEAARVFPRRGRRKGSGTFRTPRDFRRAIASAVRHLSATKRPATEENVALFLTQSPIAEHPRCDARQLRRWFSEQFGYPTWEDVLDDVMREADIHE